MFSINFYIKIWILITISSTFMLQFTIGPLYYPYFSLQNFQYYSFKMHKITNMSENNMTNHFCNTIENCSLQMCKTMKLYDGIIMYYSQVSPQSCQINGSEENLFYFYLALFIQFFQYMCGISLLFKFIRERISIIVMPISIILFLCQSIVSLVFIMFSNVFLFFNIIFSLLYIFLCFNCN